MNNQAATTAAAGGRQAAFAPPPQPLPTPKSLRWFACLGLRRSGRKGAGGIARLPCGLLSSAIYARLPERNPLRADRAQRHARRRTDLRRTHGCEGIASAQSVARLAARFAALRAWQAALEQPAGARWGFPWWSAWDLRRQPRPRQAPRPRSDSRSEKGPAGPALRPSLVETWIVLSLASPPASPPGLGGWEPFTSCAWASGFGVRTSACSRGWAWGPWRRCAGARQPAWRRGP